MKNSIILKTIAIIVAACTLTVTLASAIGIVALAGQGLYSTDYATWENQFYTARAEQLALSVAESYAARNLSNLTTQELRVIGWGNSQGNLSEMFGMDPDSWGYRIISTGGGMLEKEGLEETEELQGYPYTLKATYPISVSERGNWSEQIHYHVDDGELQRLYLRYQRSPEYKVTVWITQGGVESFSGVDLDLFKALHHLRYYFIAFFAAGLLLTVACLVYLCYAAGRSRKSDRVSPGGLNRMPLDIYTGILGMTCLFVIWFEVEWIDEILFESNPLFVRWAVLGTAAALVLSFCIVAFVVALAAQWKLGLRYVWQHSLIGWLWGKAWKLCKLCWRGASKLFNLLPLVWRYLLIALTMAVTPILCALLTLITHELGRAFWLLMLLSAVLVDVALVCYGAYAYGTVLKGARTMAEGNLDANIDTRYLCGSYKTCADDLNTLADVAVEAAKKQIKSERMKAELVTNVSHDIKTPLTSVINYIDLLQKAETEEQTKQYLEVLVRQSHKLKKLIDDLMDMSKASTGNMTVEITSLDAAEAVSQALGEFADRLEQQSLTVVLRKPEQSVMIRSDGRLLWRVLHNLMNNVVKYALPGTRIYADVEQMEGKVRISLKNISREELNISAEELTERFVRGDVSRNTEGSGLGLNIAKSFMQLQKGTMDVAIDGDLFKVTLLFEAD